MLWFGKIICQFLFTIMPIQGLKWDTSAFDQWKPSLYINRPSTLAHTQEVINSQQGEGPREGDRDYLAEKAKSTSQWTQITPIWDTEYFTREEEIVSWGRQSTSCPSWGGRDHFTREAEYPNREAEYRTKENVYLMTEAWSTSWGSYEGAVFHMGHRAHVTRKTR